MATELRQSLTFTQPQQQRLRELVHSDPEAQQHWKNFQPQADEHRNSKPQPLEVIHFEGLLNTHPDRVITTRHLTDMDRLAVLNFAYAASGDDGYAETIRAYVLAWSQHFRPTGNPINENKLYPVLTGYDLLADQWSSAERTTVEDWMKEMAALEIESARVRPDTTQHNWHTKRLNLVGTIGVVTSRPDLIVYTQDGYRDYLSTGLFPDGSSVDFHRRDALSYHQSGLKPLVVLARVLQRADLDVWHLQAENGASVERSIDWLIPFVDGRQVHQEWVKTESRLDRQRAEAGIAFYQTGKPYDPVNALELFELATYFAPRYLDVVRLLTKSNAQRFPTWMTVLCAAERCNDDSL